MAVSNYRVFQMPVTFYLVLNYGAFPIEYPCTRIKRDQFHEESKTLQMPANSAWLQFCVCSVNLVAWPNFLSGIKTSGKTYLVPSISNKLNCEAAQLRSCNGS